MPTGGPLAVRVGALIGLAYDGIDDPAAFQHMTEAACNAVGGVIGDIEVRRADSLGYVGSLGRMLSEDARTTYYAYWVKHDPLAPVMIRKPPFAVVSSDDLLARSDLVKSSFYHDWMRPNQMERFLGSVVPALDGLVLAIAFQREQRREFSHRDAVLLKTLVPHIGRSFRMLQSSSRCLAQCDSPRIVLDGDGVVVDLNPAASALLKLDVLARIEARRLRFRSKDVNAALDELVAVARLQGHGERLVVTTGPLERWVIRIAIDRVAIAPTVAPIRLLVHLEPLSWTPEYGERVLRATFNLSAAEARIALRLFGGETVEEFAFAQGISPLTARTQLKHVLNKTGTRRQPELLKLLATVFMTMR